MSVQLKKYILLKAQRLFFCQTKTPIHMHVYFAPLSVNEYDELTEAVAYIERSQRIFLMDQNESGPV